MTREERARRILAAIKAEIKRMPKVFKYDQQRSGIGESVYLFMEPWRSGEGEIELCQPVDAELLCGEEKIKLRLADVLNDNVIKEEIAGCVDRMLKEIPISVSIWDEEEAADRLIGCDTWDDVTGDLYLYFRFESRRGIYSDNEDYFGIRELFPEDALERIRDSVDWTQEVSD